MLLLQLTGVPFTRTLMRRMLNVAQDYRWIRVTEDQLRYNRMITVCHIFRVFVTKMLCKRLIETAREYQRDTMRDYERG